MLATADKFADDLYACFLKPAEIKKLITHHLFQFAILDNGLLNASPSRLYN